MYMLPIYSNVRGDCRAGSYLKFLIVPLKAGDRGWLAWTSTSVASIGWEFAFV